MNLDPTKSAARPSNEAIKPSHTGDATDLTKTEQEKIDRVAMEAATKGERRINADDQKTPDSKLFTK